MSERTVLARWLLIGGAVLLVMSLVLWFTLPIRMNVPPYLTTALLALAYGLACWISSRSGRKKKS